jgi:hypothetical protein
MLRFFVLLLLLANGAYFAWAGGHLASFGFAPAVQTEPQRLQTQIKPDAIRLMSAAEAQRAQSPSAAAPKPAECLQTGLLSEAQTDALRNATASLPAGSFSLQEATEPARWIVYMGKYPSAEALAKKKVELRELGIAFDTLKNPSLELGLSLGAFPSQSEATAALGGLATRGVRTGKVAQEFAERQGLTLRIPAVDDALRPQLERIKAVVGAEGLAACKA